MDQYPYHWYTILLGATRALTHIGVHFTHHAFGLSRVQKDGVKFKKKMKEPKLQKIVDLLTAGKGEWKGTKKTPFRSISRGDLTEEAKVWFCFIKYVLIPSNHLSKVRREEAIILYVVLKGYKINVGKIIKKSILGYSNGNCRKMIPHQGMIIRLCI